jgi:hypothetical protein
MQLPFSRLSLSALSIVTIMLSASAFAAPISQNGTVLRARADCEYGNRLEFDDYFFYLLQNYPTDKILLWSGGSIEQVQAFKGPNPDYLYYRDVFTYKDGNPYARTWPKDENGCYRPDDAEASSRAIAAVATGQVLVFGAVQWQQTQGGRNSYFGLKEIPELRRGFNSGRLSKILHMVKDTLDPSQVLAEEDVNGKITYVNGNADGTPNSTGQFGDCSAGTAPPCDVPGNA